MAKTKSYLWHVITVGMLVTIFYAGILVTIRGYFLHQNKKETDDTKYVSLLPSGLAPQYDEDPNYYPSCASAVVNPVPFWTRWGIYQDMSIALTQRNWQERTYPFYSCEFDPSRGLMVATIQMHPSYSGMGKYKSKTSQIYAGPEGVAEQPENLGRFSESSIISSGVQSHEYILYDPTLSRFFLLDLSKPILRTGPELPNTFIIKGLLPESYNFWRDLEKNKQFIELGWGPPRLKTDQRHLETLYKDRPSWLRVLEPSGKISLLNTTTLEFEKYPNGPPRPGKDVLAYRIRPVCEAGKMIGVIAGSLTSSKIILDVYHVNQEGILSTPKHAEADLPFSKATYLLESIQGPLWGLFSLIAAPGIDVVENQRAVFILGDSAEGRLGQVLPKHGLVVLGVAMGMLFPSLLLSLVLAQLTTRNAKTLGFSKQACRWWMYGVFVFGLPAYITYRLTRPRMVMVTCINCGKLRRPDWDHCQHCGSAWQVPELTPPAWRVLTTANASGPGG